MEDSETSVPHSRGWSERDIENGFQQFEITTWAGFQDCFNVNFTLKKSLLWRGQADARWLLESTLSRHLKNLYPDNLKNYDSLTERHIKSFENSVLGRRGSNPAQLTEDELWGLGRHYGLAAPFVDFTRSPYVALFFAFAEDNPPASVSRAVWAILPTDLTNRYAQLFAAREEFKSYGNHRIVGGARGVGSGIPDEQPVDLRLFHPKTHDNKRLLSQQGLFVKIPTSIDLESWVRSSFEKEQRPVLYKISIDGSLRSEILVHLNRMNINYLTLFPDLTGSSLHTNMELQIKGY